MSSKKVYNLHDKVFAKIRGYPAWPAIISEVKADTPSRKKYNVHFYGTGERAECKSEELFPYEENKAKLGKPNKRKYFAEALLEIEGNVAILPQDFPKNDVQEFTSPNNTGTIEQVSLSTNVIDKVSEIEKTNESNSETEGKLTIDESNVSKGKKLSSSKKSLGLNISKGTKRKISDVKPEEPSKKTIISKMIKNDDNLQHSPIVLVEPLQSIILEKATSFGQKSETAVKKTSADQQTSEITESNETLNTTEPILESSETVLDNSKTPKSISHIKNSPSSNSEISSNSSNVGKISRSGRKIKPKKYSDYQNDAEVPKRSRLSKENSKSSEKQNNSINESDTSSEKNGKTKGSSTSSSTSETQKSAPKISKNYASASVPHINETISNELDVVSDKINQDDKFPVALKGLMTDSLSIIKTDWKKTSSNKITKVDLLHTEVDLLDYVHKLRTSLRIDQADYDLALALLEQISELEINALMLKKHDEIVDTIQKVTKYIGNMSEWGLNEQETIIHTENATKVRRKASTVYNKFISLFTVPEGQTFQEVFRKEVEDFFTKTKHLPCDQIYGITSDN